MHYFAASDKKGKELAKASSFSIIYEQASIWKFAADAACGRAASSGERHSST